MSQTSSLSVPNSAGSTFRANNNTNLAALFSSNSGATAPSPTVGGMLWLDTGVSPAVLRQRNTANTAWIVLNPETVPAGGVWGNNGGSAAPLSFMTAADLLTLQGFTWDNGAVKKQQIATGMRLEAGTGVSGASGVTITFSAAFAATPIFLAYAYNTSVLRFMTSQNLTTSSVTVQGWTDASTLSNVLFTWIAFGK